MRRSLALLLICLGPGTAHAYRTASDTAGFETVDRVRWVDGSVSVEISSWLPAELDRAATRAAVSAALASWDGVACADLVIDDLGLVDTVAAPGDGRVTLQWLPSAWTGRGFAAEGGRDHRGPLRPERRGLVGHLRRRHLPQRRAIHLDHRRRR